jgi:hypothetical protein
VFVRPVRVVRAHEQEGRQAHTAMVGTAPKGDTPDVASASSAMIVERRIAIARGTTQPDRTAIGPSRKLSQSNDEITRRCPSIPIDERAARIRGGDDEANA